MMKFFCLCLVLIVSGCCYPKYQLQSLDDSKFKNKRTDNNIVDIKDFVRPEQTADTLKQLTWQQLSLDKEENTVLNILSYVQNIKQTNEDREYWQYPRETILKGGDCEDKAFLLLSALIQAGVNGAQGVKGHYLGQGHIWVEYNGYILDPSLKSSKLIPVKKSAGYTPFFKFDQNNFYYCETERSHR